MSLAPLIWGCSDLLEWVSPKLGSFGNEPSLSENFLFLHILPQRSKIYLICQQYYLCLPGYYKHNMLLMDSLFTILTTAIFLLLALPNIVTRFRENIFHVKNNLFITSQRLQVDKL